MSKSPYLLKFLLRNRSRVLFLPSMHGSCWLCPPFCSFSLPHPLVFVCWTVLCPFICLSVCFLRQFLFEVQAVLLLTMQTRLVLNSQRSACLCLLSAGIKGVRHHHYLAYRASLISQGPISLSCGAWSFQCALELSSYYFIDVFASLFTGMLAWSSLRCLYQTLEPG